MNNNYPTITLSEDNSEIEHCALFPAFVGLFANFTMKDGTHFSHADVISYEDGAFLLCMNGAYVEPSGGDSSYTIVAPISAIANITYI